MNLLILSSNNGAGHNSAGRAILEEAHGRGIPGAMVDALSLDAPWKSKAVAEIHIQGALHAPRLFRVGNRRRRRPASGRASPAATGSTPTMPKSSGSTSGRGATTR